MMRRPRWRKMTWVLLIWSALILVWAIAGGASANHSCTSTNDTILSARQLQDACDAGTTIGVAAVLLIGFFGFLFFALIWFMTRPKGRPCPACGDLVRRRVTVCGSCGHDFAAAARTPAAAAGWMPPATP